MFKKRFALILDEQGTTILTAERCRDLNYAKAHISENCQSEVCASKKEIEYRDRLLA